MRRLLLIALSLTVVLCTGCVKMHMDTVIEKDGSGTCTVTYSMAREVADALAKMSDADPDAMGGDQDIPMLKDMTRDKMDAACKKAGVKLVDHQFTDDATGQSLTMKLGFDDVSDLSKALDVTDDGDGDQDLLGIFRAEDGNYVLKTVTVSRDESEEEPEETEAEAMDMGNPEDMAKMQEAMQYMGVLMAHIGDMDIRMAVTVPGDVISSNAPEVEGRTSVWTVNAANMMAAEDMDMEPAIVFSSKGLKIKTMED